MNNKDAKELLDKYFAGECSPEERILVDRAYNLHDKQYAELVSEEQFEAMKTEVWAKLDLSASRIKKTYRLWPRIAVAAAAISAITLGIWLYANEVSSSRRSSRNAEMVMNDVEPGKNTATLTLADGRTIVLSDTKTGVVIGPSTTGMVKGATSLTYNDGSLIDRHPELVSGSQTREAVLLTATTPRGGTYQVTLPDGTRVWLNADSKITFPSQFTGKVRKVHIAGEAYFEVAKDKAHPFIVESKAQEVEVLGTHFNVCAYADEAAVKTTLLEGSVMVSPYRANVPTKTASIASASTRGGSSDIKDLSNRRDGMILKPGQQALNSDRSLKVTEADVETVTDWKNGSFVLNRLDFHTAMRKIARWYDVEVVYDSSVPKDIESSGYISRTNKLSDVLRLIEKSGQVSFRIEGKKVYVSK